MFIEVQQAFDTMCNVIHVVGVLNFVLDPGDYGEGNHTVVVTATNLLGGTTEFTFTFGKYYTYHTCINDYNIIIYLFCV